MDAVINEKHTIFNEGDVVSFLDPEHPLMKRIINENKSRENKFVVASVSDVSKYKTNYSGHRQWIKLVGIENYKLSEEYFKLIEG